MEELALIKPIGSKLEPCNVVALLTSQELIEVTRREAQVCTLLDCGMRYEGIKAVLLRKEEAA